MKLNAIYGIFPMFHRHDLSVLCDSRDPQAVRHGVRGRRQRVVSRHGGLPLHPPEQLAVRVQCNDGLLAVHQLPGIGDIRSVHLADGLVSQTDPQNRDFPLKMPDHILTDSRVFRPARPRRYNDMAGSQHLYILYGQFIVARHFQIGIDQADQLIHIVRKAVIVIDQ